MHLGNPIYLLYPLLAVHITQEPDKGSEKSYKEGIYLILINKWFPELSVGLYHMRGDSYYKATQAFPWNSVGMLLLWVYCISWEDLIALSSRNVSPV